MLSEKERGEGNLRLFANVTRGPSVIVIRLGSDGIFPITVSGSGTVTGR